jgi:hypothetical protein
MKTRELTVFLFVLTLVTPAFALDMGYYGFVTVGGSAAADGTVVSVWVGTTQVGTSTIPYYTAPSGSGYYKLTIPQEYTGYIAEFRVDGALALTKTLASGSNYLNITVVGPYCGDAICNNGENCATCPGDCGITSGQVCCGGTVYTGECCSDSDCSSGATCSSHACHYPSSSPPTGGGGVVTTTTSSGPVCGDGTCDSGEDCTNCPDDCGVLACENGIDCNDGNSCTIDICTGVGCGATCNHESITICQTGDNCCPAGCTLATDDDCACINECADGSTKCEGNTAYECQADLNGCYKWGDGSECSEGCCDDNCCGSETLGLTGLAVTGGEFVPFLYILLGLIIVGAFAYYYFRMRK